MSNEQVHPLKEISALSKEDNDHASIPADYKPASVVPIGPHLPPEEPFEPSEEDADSQEHSVVTDQNTSPQRMASVRSIAVRKSGSMGDMEEFPGATISPSSNPASNDAVGNSELNSPKSKNIKSKRLKSMVKAVITSNDMVFQSRKERVSLTYNEVLTEREYLKKYLVVPTSKFRVAWDVVTTIFVLYLCVEVPLLMGFDWWKYPTGLVALDYCIDVWFCIDVVLNFRTGFMKDGKLIMEPKRIAKHYLSFWFWIDLVSVFPFEALSLLIIMGRKDTKVVRKMIKVLSKWFKMPRLLRLGKVFRSLKTYGKYANVVLVVLTVAFLTHIVACFWVLFLNPCEQVSDILYVEGEASTQVQEFYASADYKGICSQAAVPVYYAKALHVSITMLLGGSARTFDNDLMRQAWILKPITLHAVSSVVMFLGSITIAVLFAYLTTIVVKTANSSWAFFNRIASVKEQLGAMHLPQELGYRVMRHYDYLWAQKLWVQSSFLDDPTLSANLKREIRLHIYKPYFIKTKLLSTLTDEIIMKLTSHLIPEICMPDENIMIKGETGDRMWLVTKGKVFIIHEIGAEVSKVLGGSIVGVCEMVDGGPRMHTVSAGTIAELMVLEAIRFHDIMKHYPRVMFSIQNQVAELRSLGDSTQELMNHIQSLRFFKKSMDDFCLDSIEEEIQGLTLTVNRLSRHNARN